MIKYISKFVFVSAFLMLAGLSFTTISFAANQPLTKESLTHPQIQTLAPTTDGNLNVKPIYSNNGGTMSCPPGYALTYAQMTAQQTQHVDVYRDCVGGSIMGAVYTTCYMNPAHYNPVSSAPSMTYGCQKITNKWVKKS